ncbi:MAG TPA: peptidoglycan-binding protein, partial [Flavobacteriaceae bacterium]|nr:peptidoglycan-binding protein [Flavobacteriaceae bacterium]HBS10969.1 peptidoglycan-binding protein [Flavobacteriaceae bacterium]
MNKLRLTVLLFLIIVSVFSQEKPYVTYQVNKGETVFSVSQKFNTTTQNLLTLNPDIKDNIISENQILIIPNKKY